METRAKYKAHVAAMFKLAGVPRRARANAPPRPSSRMETRLAAASLDNVALRDPQATDHKTTFAELQKLTPHFDWAAYFQAQPACPPADFNVAAAEVPAEVDRQLARDAAHLLEDLPQVAPAARRRPRRSRGPS